VNRHAHLIGTGTRALSNRLLDWVAQGTRRASAGRLLGLAAAGWMLGGLALAAPGLLAPAAAAWAIAAWRTGRAAERHHEAELAFVQLLADAIGDRNGVLLADVLLLLHRDGLFPDWTVTDIRAQCEALDIPVRDKIKVGGVVSVGVHTDDLTAVWDVQARPAPPGPSRQWHAAVTSDNYLTTPEEEPSGGGAVDLSLPADDTAGEVTT
jgi:hypothetical protein